MADASPATLHKIMPKTMIWIGRRRVGMPFFMDLPQEIVDRIYDHLTNRDIKNARLAGRVFCEILILRFPRVFISPNTRNLNVFCAVAQRDELRKQVVEIIWDEARFEKQERKTFDESLKENDEMLSKLNPNELDRRYNALWPTEAGKERPKMSYDQSFNHYEGICADQEFNIKYGWDAGAFRSGLAWFPNLRRVIVTSQTYGQSYLAPRYMTPMIRSFPPGFNYTLPQPWIGPDDIRIDGTVKFIEPSFEKRAKHWHGVYVVAVSLNTRSHKVREFVVEASRQPVGIDYALFHVPRWQLYSFMGVFKSLERLDLALNTKGASASEWTFLRGGLLREALAEAHHLTHFSFQISPWLDLKRSFMDDKYVPLFEIFPVYCWHNLRHLSLMGLHADIDDLVLFLTGLSPRVQQVELHDFQLRRRHFDCGWVVGLMWIKLGCPRMGKKLTIGIGLWPADRVWIRDRIQLYFNGGVNPFERNEDGTAVDERTLGIVKNDFDEGLE